MQSAPQALHQCLQRMAQKLTAAKMWAAFKTFFAAEYHNLKEQQKVNTANNSLVNI
jgi:hypothetical protein